MVACYRISGLGSYIISVCFIPDYRKDRESGVGGSIFKKDGGRYE